MSIIIKGYRLDKEKQKHKIFPHYERFKTDGVEHNLYIESLFPLQSPLTYYI
jgi:hypothetical protein